MQLFNRLNLLFLALFLSICLSAQSQSTVKISEELSSNIIGQQTKYSVYLPASYSNEETFPTLYLLHGIGGNETSWIKRTEIQNIVDSLIIEKVIPPIIIVMPDGKNSYYINDYKNKFAFEDYFINELVPFIDSAYTHINDKQNRAICGLSMGGFGATILSVKHPDYFSTSINLSGAVRTPEQFIALSPVKYHSYFAPIYGDSLKGDERITEHWKQNSPYFIVDSLYAEKLTDINWYIDCGMQDFLYPANKALHELFMKNNILHEYHMRPGSHSWEYWQKGIIQALVYWGEKLKE